jgi:8-oxo-dGTP pyrophosphatase MutT (NUDIX family)
MHPEQLLFEDPGKKFKVFGQNVKEKDGTESLHTWVWRRDGVRIIAVDARGRMLLQREFRYELDGYDWKLPGGKLDRDESIEAAASRELREETGVSANTWIRLSSTIPDSSVRFQRHFFVATGLTMGAPNRDNGEAISVHWVTADEARKRALDGSVQEEIAALAILRYLHNSH